MTALSGKDIQHLMSSQTALGERLIVSPVLEPAEQLKEEEASIDLRLGFLFGVTTPSTSGAIDELAPEICGDVHRLWQRLFRRVYVPFGRSIVLHPHQFMLALTLEYIRLPRNVMAFLMGRSSWGRLGLIVATAVGVHPGFTGCLAFELRNLGETPIVLYPGQTIAQLFFLRVDTIPGKVLGQYSGATDVLPGKLSSEETLRKIASLVDRFSS